MALEANRSVHSAAQQPLRVEAALLATLFDRLPIVLGLNLSVALMTVLVFAGVHRPAILAGWLLLTLAVLGFRLGAWRRFQGSRTDLSRVRDRARSFTIGAGATGTAWGLAAVLFYTPDSLIAQIYVPFIIAGMVGGSITALSGHMPAYFAFLVSAIVPYASRLAVEGDLPHLAMAGLALLYMVGIGGLGRVINASLVDAVRLAIENQDLFAALRQKTTELEVTFDHVNQGVAVFDADHRLSTWNPRHQELHGYPPELYRRGTELGEFVHHDLARASAGDRADRFEVEHLRGMMERPAPARFEQGGAGARVLEVERSTMPDGGFVSTSTDVTERKRAEARMLHLAQHDSLTGLPNRLLFHDRLGQAMARSRRECDLLAVVLLDLDKFKEINDALGHGIGDRALQELANRLRTAVRDTDTVARIGGDEFALILTALPDADPAVLVAQKILDRLAEPLRLEGRSFRIYASLGIALFPCDGDSTELLLKNADLAMYEAKAAGEGFRLFRGAGRPGLERGPHLAQELARAIDRERLALEYQPILDLRRQKVVGVEALLRWRHSELGQVDPEAIVETAEASGQIDRISEWALARACTAAAGWPSEPGAPFRIAVNVSATQLSRRNLVDLVGRALAGSGLPATRLDLELTESSALSDEDGVVATLERLRDIGVRLSLDDFGTGYASLRHLKRFPLDALKIDRSFVAELIDDPQAAIVCSLIELAHRLGLRVIAEGVESEVQLEALRRLGCDEVQGHIVGHPLGADQTEAWLRERLDAVT